MVNESIFVKRTVEPRGVSGEPLKYGTKRRAPGGGRAYVQP